MTTGCQRKIASQLLWILALCVLSVEASSRAVNEGGVGDASVPIEHDYVGVGKCKSCHAKELMGDQVAVWRRGPHGSAFEILMNEQSQEIALEEGLEKPAHQAPECLACHVTAYGVPPARISRPLKQEDGVQCESCHGPGRSYRKKKIMSEPEKAHANGLWQPSKDPGICLSCHNRQSPTFDPKRFILKDGSTADFDYEQAAVAIAHPIPEEVKGRYLELDEARKEAEKEASGY